MTDERGLLTAARGGSESAFGALVTEHRSGLEVLCCMMLGDRVAGRRALGETLLTAWRERGLIDATTDARTWLYRTAARICIQAVENQPISSAAEDRWTW